MKNNFIKYLESKNLSKSTQGAYLRDVNLFFAWFKQNAENCTKKDIIKYLEYLKNKKGHENITRRNALIALNHYFTFLQQNEAIESNPTALLKIRGIKKTSLYNIYTAEQLQS